MRARGEPLRDTYGGSTGGCNTGSYRDPWNVLATVPVEVLIVAARLCREERDEIACLYSAGWSGAAIARVLGRAPSTVCREIARNSNSDASYRGATAQRRADRAARRPKQRRFQDEDLARFVSEHLEQRLSPQAVALLCQRRGTPVSHETIYREIYRPSSWLDPKAHQWLCRPRPGRKRRQRTSRTYHEPLGVFRTIWERPDRTRPGHWEGDLLVGKQNHTACVVICETSTGYTLVGALPNGQGTIHVTDVIATLFSHVPGDLRHTLTWDRGRELTQWPRIETATNLDVYFCDPRSPWQKGLVEGTCGLLRRWLPRHQDITPNQHELETITKWINHMPRYKRGGATTHELYTAIATTS